MHPCHLYLVWVLFLDIVDVTFVMLLISCSYSTGWRLVPRVRRILTSGWVVTRRESEGPGIVFAFLLLCILGRFCLAPILTSLQDVDHRGAGHDHQLQSNYEDGCQLHGSLSHYRQRGQHYQVSSLQCHTGMLIKNCVDNLFPQTCDGGD